MNLSSIWLSTAIGLSALLVAADVSGQSSYGEARAEHWYIGGGLGGFSEKDNSQLSRRISVGLEYRWMKIDAIFEPFIAGNIDAGGQFLFATVRGRF